MQSKIDLGVSLYGFTEQWVNDEAFGFEDMFKELNRLGITKFEIVGSQMFNTYPIVSDEEVNRLLDLCKKYNVTPFSYAGQVDGGKFSDHDMTDEEIMSEATFDLMSAYKLGCKYMRGYGIPNHLAPQMAKMAEFYDIKVGFEIHAPSKPSDAQVQELVKIIKETGSKYIGLVPDFGCFIEKPNAQMLKNLLASGANPALLDFIVANRHTTYTEESLWEKVEQMGGKQIDKLAISQMLSKPGPWNIFFVGIGETLPNSENRMTLSNDKKDQWGLPLVELSVEYGENEKMMRKPMGDDMAEMLNSAGFKEVRTIPIATNPGYGIHEMGTARMGKDPKTSVLNKFNQIHACKNVFITDGAAMSSSSCVNPSLTYMALTARAANFAVSELKKENL